MITQVIEVHHESNRSLQYLVCLSKCHMSIIELNIEAQPKLKLVKKIQLEVECICASLWE